MNVDRYTKVILTVIALALVALALNPWLGGLGWGPALGVRPAEAQAPAAPAPPPAAGAPAAPPAVIPAPAFGAPWWDDCTVTSKETVPAGWGRLVGVAPGAFVFESDDTIRLARTAPFETVGFDPTKKPCKILEIKRVK